MPLLNIREEEDRIRNEADTLYQMWHKALNKYGGRDDYWMKIIEMSGEFGDKYGSLGSALILARFDELEREWKEIKKHGQI